MKDKGVCGSTIFVLSWDEFSSEEDVLRSKDEIDIGEAVGKIVAVSVLLGGKQSHGDTLALQGVLRVYLLDLHVPSFLSRGHKGESLVHALAQDTILKVSRLDSCPCLGL